MSLLPAPAAHQGAPGLSTRLSSELTQFPPWWRVCRMLRQQGLDPVAQYLRHSRSGQTLSPGESSPGLHLPDLKLPEPLLGAG